MLPIFTSRAGLVGCPSQSTLPSSQARPASALVLKNLAAQSHLSIRTEVMCCVRLRSDIGTPYLYRELPPDSTRALDRPCYNVLWILRNSAEPPELSAPAAQGAFWPFIFKILRVSSCASRICS